MKNENEVSAAPAVFYRPGSLHAIKFTFLCDYPYSTPNVYAVYLNGQTKLPERVFLKEITPRQLSHDLILEDIYRHTGWMLKTIEENLTKAGIEFILPTENEQ